MVNIFKFKYLNGCTLYMSKEQREREREREWRGGGCGLGKDVCTCAYACILPPNFSILKVNKG